MDDETATESDLDISDALGRNEIMQYCEKLLEWLHR